jgi:hypothetical protein
MKEKILKNWKNILIIILSILLVSYYFKFTTQKWDVIYNEKAVPDVELVNYLSFNSNGVVSGSATGFVVFDDIEKQPKDLRQYVQIAASNKTINGKQIFYLTDIIKMNNLAPRYFDPSILTVTNIANNIITLSDSENNLYMINTNTKEISMFDSTKDVTKLITNSFDFQDYIVKTLK